MLHHLQGREQKQQTLREARRVLKPGGSLHLLDFSAAHSGQGGRLMRWLHPHHVEQDGDERIRRLMTDAGLANPAVLQRRTLLLFMHATYFRAGR
jgi:ubiquinone/menaquinone biosynthesis C-methylase UbiE